MFFEDMRNGLQHEAINDHSDCLKLLETHIAGVKCDFERLTKEAADNDKQLKENLETLESTVTAQGSDTEKLRSQAQDSLKEVAAYVETLRLGASGAAAEHGAESASLELKMVALSCVSTMGSRSSRASLVRRVRNSSWGPSKARPRWTS